MPFLIFYVWSLLSDGIYYQEHQTSFSSRAVGLQYNTAYFLTDLMSLNILFELVKHPFYLYWLYFKFQLNAYFLC
jgi:hypothetical protein